MFGTSEQTLASVGVIGGSQGTTNLNPRFESIETRLVATESATTANTERLVATESATTANTTRLTATESATTANTDSIASQASALTAVNTSITAVNTSINTLTNDVAVKYGATELGTAEATGGAVWTVGSKRVLLHEESQIARSVVLPPYTSATITHSPIASMSDVPPRAYHSVEIVQTSNQYLGNRSYLITTWSNKITPVNITSTASVPFTIPTGGAGVYQIGYGLWVGYGSPFYNVVGQCYINGNGGNNTRLDYARHLAFDKDFTTVSRTFLEPLADGDTVTFEIGMWGNANSYRVNGQAFIHRVG